jgi:hypothetical protein
LKRPPPSSHTVAPPCESRSGAQGDFVLAQTRTRGPSANGAREIAVNQVLDSAVALPEATVGQGDARAVATAWKHAPAPDAYEVEHPVAHADCCSPRNTRLRCRRGPLATRYRVRPRSMCRSSWAMTPTAATEAARIGAPEVPGMCRRETPASAPSARITRPSICRVDGARSSGAGAAAWPGVTGQGQRSR